MSETFLTITEPDSGVTLIVPAPELGTGTQGPQGIPGPQGPQGVPGTGGNTVIWPQAAPLAAWLIQHNLNRFPSIAIIDSAGAIVEGDVVYVSANLITATFSAAFSGTAYLN